MPGLNYKTGVPVTGASAEAAAAPRFYDGSPGRELVKCPECLRLMDPLFPHDKDTPGCARIAAETRELRAWLARSTTQKERQWGK